MNVQDNSIPEKTTKIKSFSIWRFIKRIFITLLILLVVAIGGGFAIGYFYQDEVKEYIVGELNKQLNTQIIVDGKDIDFTVLKNFPLASVDFKNVKALDATQSTKKDTLFKAKEISFQFNILDVFKKNYRIKHIELNDITLRVRIDKKGNDNYHFWKKSSDTTQTNLSFALETIVLNKIHLDYKNSKAKQLIDVLIKKGNLSGEFYNKKYALKIDADWLVNKFKVDSTIYLQNKNVNSKLTLNVDAEKESYKIESGKLKVENLLFEVFGNLIMANDKPLVNMAIKGKDIDIKSVLSLIPAKYKTKINDYESTGEFYFNATLEGDISESDNLKIKADFGINDADITHAKNNISLKNVNLKGNYSNGDNSIFKLSSFSAILNEGSIKGNLLINNNTAFSGEIKANTNLEELQKLIKIDTIETISGKIIADVLFSGELKSLKNKQYRSIKTSGDLSITEAKLKLKNNSLDFNSITGDFKFDNNDLIVNDFSGKISNSDFQLRGFFRNVIGYLFEENQSITIEAALNANELNLNELLANSSQEKKSSKYKLQFSELVDANLSTNIEHLVFRKFDATNIKGLVKLKDRKMILDPITLSTMGGTVTTAGMIDGSDTTQLLITCFSDVNKINITKMFESFENFGQQTITNKNIKGKATAKIQFATVLSPELKMDMDKLYAGADMIIENGELNNVESMKSLSTFIELKDLENIKFETLKNQIEIKKQTVVIPKMEVKSTALNVYASGSHTFKNEINYKVKLSLSELLAKKAIKAKKENEEFGQVADDGLGRRNIFLSMTGNIDNPKIKYDSKSALQNVKEDLKVEKQTLKSILKEEFGLFKKDSTVSNKYKKAGEEDAKFKMNWEESGKKEEKPTDVKSIKPPPKKESEDF